ncbi:hypothetical protein RHORCCE3_1258 [Rickettsia hoogstraalii str. RCCE3]|nr:hypothetical protein RHORCCE3_1258 [Rickettsia hoogstraalii str. RCCE3]
MSNPFQLIQEFKFTEAVGVLASTNVNERGNIIFQLKKPDGTIFPYAAINVNALEALCFMNSVLTLTSNNQQQIKDKVILLKNCIKTAYNKMENHSSTIWDGRDNNGNTTAHWLAWGGATEELYGLLNKHLKLIEDEKKLSRNVFDVTMEVEHLNVEQKKELAKVLIPLGIQINNLNTYNIILQNNEYLECLKVLRKMLVIYL